MKTGFRVLAGLVLFLVPVAAARADMALPPTLCLDFLYLDRPYSFLVGASMFAAAIAFGFWLRKRSVPWLLAIAVPLVLFVGADIGLYIYGLDKQNRTRAEYRKAHMNEAPVFRPTEKLSEMPKEVN